jgi:hypothetical protein
MPPRPCPLGPVARAGLLAATAVLVGATLGGCAHNDPNIQRLRADPGKALQSARRDVAKECLGHDPTPEACCSALLDEGDALVAGNQTQAAIDSYELARTRCPRFPDSRRRLFLARPQPASTDAAPISIDAMVKLDLDVQLGDDVRLAWYSAYVDGEPVDHGRGKMWLATGLHEIAVELYLQPITPGTLGGPIRIDVAHPIELPRALARQGDIVGGSLIWLRDNRGAGGIAERVTADAEAIAFRRWQPPPKGAVAEVATPGPPVMLAPPIGAAQLITPEAERYTDAVKHVEFSALLKICVNDKGTVDDIAAMTTTNPGVIPDLSIAVRRWVYRPYHVSGHAVPFCTVQRVQGPLP